MKTISILLFLLSVLPAYSQSIEAEPEELVNFKSSLIDYTVHDDKVVALTRKNREYFIFYQDTKGANLFQAVDIFFATDLEIDCMGNLFLVGLDSAFQLEITDYITKVQVLDIETYKSNIRTCKALFEESLVRESVNNSLVYEPLDDSLFAKHPVLFTIQIWTDGGSNLVLKTPRARQANMGDATLVDDRNTNIRNDILTTPNPVGRARVVHANRPYSATSELDAFQVGDSLWVFDKENEILLVYDEKGHSDGLKHIEELPFEFKLIQDRVTQDVYIIYNDGGLRIFQKVDEYGCLSKPTLFFKGFSKSYLKMSNGYLYFRDSKGAGESIKRVPLN